MLKYVVIVLIVMLTPGCVTTPDPHILPLDSIKRELPEGRVSESEFREILSQIANNHFDGVEQNITGSNRFVSNKKVIQKCWAGFIYGGNLPCRLVQMEVVVDSFDPLKGYYWVSNIRGTMASNYAEKVVSGNNFSKEKEIYNELSLRLEEVTK